MALALVVSIRPGDQPAGATVPPCSSTDGPQFKCWLDTLPATR